MYVYELKSGQNYPPLVDIGICMNSIAVYSNTISLGYYRGHNEKFAGRENRLSWFLSAYELIKAIADEDS